MAGGMTKTSNETDEDGGAQPWWAAALKVGIGVALADAIGRLLGFPTPTLAAITAAFTAGQPPATSRGKALRRALAAMLGVGLGVGVALARGVGVPPTPAFLAVGLVAGALRPRSADYLYSVVVGIVVANAAATSEQPLAQLAAEKAALVAIGLVVGPIVAHAVDGVRGAWARRR